MSMREPTVLIRGRELTCSEAVGLAALAGCDATARENTAAAVKAHLITRIYAPLPAGPGRTIGRFRWLDRRAPAAVIARSAVLSRASAESALS